MATIKNNKYWQGWGEIGTLVYCWWECKVLHSLWKTVWWLLKKLRTELPYDPTILLPGIHPQELKARSLGIFVQPHTQ